MSEIKRVQSDTSTSKMLIHKEAVADCNNCKYQDINRSKEPCFSCIEGGVFGNWIKHKALKS